MNTYSQTPSNLFRPAACYRFKLLLVEFEPERLCEKIRSKQLLGSSLRQRISPDSCCSVKVSVHEFHAFIAYGGTHQCRESSNSRPQSHFAALSALSYFLYPKRCTTLSPSRPSKLYTLDHLLFSENARTVLCPLVRTLPAGEALAQERRHGSRNVTVR